ncbi:MULTISPECIES: DUF2809 domain-containing protein [unclassified Microcoleus]|uniref:DUF2809 domain-containing protein n=1 Tax=unclassified Microcoleus TaxID=2642155 RepID=UPI00403F669C
MLKEWGVLLFYSAIEFSQLWLPRFLQWIRARLFGYIFMGSSFACEDFIGYIFGCIVEWVLVVCLKHKIMKRHQKS